MKWWPHRCIRCFHAHYRHEEMDCPCKICKCQSKPYPIEEKAGWSTGLELMQGVRRNPYEHGAPPELDRERERLRQVFGLRDDPFRRS